MSKPKPCPFCGSRKVTCEKSGHDWTVMCHDCFADGPLTPSRVDAIRMWEIPTRGGGASTDAAKTAQAAKGTDAHGKPT